MSLSTLPLSYCTNVHPAQSVDEVLAGLKRYTAEVQVRCGRPIAAGLWLAQPVIQELVVARDGAEAEIGPGVARLKEALAASRLACYTLNAFPFGNFHSERVKDQVYIPDWSTAARRDYSVACARVLAELLPEGCDGSLSTLPLAFKGHTHTDDFEGQCIEQLLDFAVAMDVIHDETGRCIRLGIEPEPFCLLETTPETLAFFQSLWRRAEETGRGDVARRHLGVCYDVCHQAVEFESIPESIAALNKAGIRINKLHITCALHLETPADPEQRQELARFVEPRYLHQTISRSRSGIALRRVDLDQELCTSPPASWKDASAWRIHFHAPVHRETMGLLKTTQAELQQALAAVKSLDYAPHLEVETYTWGVLPEGRQPDLTEGLAAEMTAVFGWLDDLRGRS